MSILKDMNEKRQALKKLVEAFKKNIGQYQGPEYKEQRLRMDFIDKFFELFDWDISNEEGAIEEFRDVVIEDNLEIQGGQKNPDYSFRIGSDIVFFVEAKKPSINIKESIPFAFQLRRYGFSAKLNISILTDFQEFAIYNTGIKPNKNDKPDFARIFYCTYEEYEKNFDFLYGLLAKDNARKGSIKDHMRGPGIKKGTSPLDKEFLKLIEDWRSELAKNIAKNNKKTGIENINAAIQKIIDGIVFLRIAEEKGIELYENLLTISKNEKNIYKLLVEYFDKANKKYDSELFRHESFFNDLDIDDEILRDILKGLYPPECPYAFSVLPVEILGNIYEQFLGKTIRLTESHQAKIEEKPEVRKAGGVYYTPKYIVDYIVKNTVGEKIKGATPKQIEKLKILDPACGSGSFLLGAYSYLLNHHLAYYTLKDNINKALKKENIFQAGKNSFRLTIQEKQKILLGNIFGVDIDAQAVEVTKLSMLLKLMEGESDESAGQLFKHSDIKLLPTLTDNIKCGNSLIGPDFYKDKNLSLFGNEEMKKINDFDWNSKEKGFGEIMNKGGFDVVIGNPPYVFTRELMSNEEKRYYNAHYSNIQFKLNTYVLFSEKAFNLLNREGYFGFILPNNWLSLEYASDFRKFILTKTFDTTIVNSIDKVFQDASVDTSILLFCKSGQGKVHLIELLNNEFKQISVQNKDDILSAHNYVINIHLHKASGSLDICNKIKSTGVPLQDIAEVKNGVQAYTVGEGTPKQTKQMKEERVYHSKTKKNNSWIKYVDGVDVKRYFLGWSGQYIKYGKNLSRPRELRLFNGDRILVRQIPAKPPHSILACYTDEQLINDNNSMIIKTKSNNERELKYILGLLNTKLMSFWFINTFGKLQRTIFPQFKIKELSIFPIKTMSEILKIQQNKIILLVDQIEASSKLMSHAKSESNKKHYQQKIDLLDKQIDELVYELYGLTKEEIKVVEGS